MSTKKNKKIQAEGIGTRLRELREKEKMSVRAFASVYGAVDF
jgi:DNA-binding transcriptional regulator YiaG